MDRMGPLEKMLNDTLIYLKVERQAYHGNVFVGNHCKIILHNYNLICNVLNDHPSFKEIFLKIFKLFAAPRDLLFAKRFLTEEEINDVCRDCHEFCNIYTVLFKNKTIKPKMHFYSFDVPRFLKHLKQLDC